MSKAIIIVDMQNDFVEGGALAVAGGLALIPRINTLLKANPDAVVITTQDWHPTNHSQFKVNGGLWPVHCVQNSLGAELVDGLELPEMTHRIIKGYDPAKDGYSGFEGTLPNTTVSLNDVLTELDVNQLIICGIATDYCVLATALDGIKLGYAVEVALGCVAGVADETTQKAIATMGAEGVILNYNHPIS